MTSNDFKKICRICLDASVVLDWNATLYGYCNITYKDCFYKYTQLECLVSDPFSPMLCQICLNGLYNVHTLILKALESHKYFQEICKNFDYSTSLEDDIKYTPTEFETVLVEKIKVEPIIEDHFIYEHSDEESIKEAVITNDIKTSKRYISATSKPRKQKKCKNKIDKSIKTENKIKKCTIGSDIRANNYKNNLTQALNETIKKSRRKAKLKELKKHVDGNEITSEQNYKNMELEDDLLDEIIRESGEQVEPKVRKKYKEIKKPRMCSICSKILHNKYAVQMHEKTHMENRERKETCKICGLKFYDKRNLYSHKRIHKENREKNHKCEFCSKAFYDKGGLNIHRRIHLGQMIPCSLCAKQYFRQIDLDRHMSSHSATIINSDTKKRSRYFVRCQHCDKSILSTSFKSHTAAHLNEPLMKCSICSKEFFRRGSCVLHIKKVHQKTNEEYNDFIIQYKKNRISHLFLEQNADIQFTNE